MKYLLVLAIAIGCMHASAQKIVDHVIIITKTSMTMPEDFSPTSAAGAGGGAQMIVINGMAAGEDNETKTWFKGDHLKTITEMGMGLNTIITDTKSKRTTTLIEAMGTKTGFYSTEKDEQERKQHMDSLTGQVEVTIKDVNITDLSDGLKIAGYASKKALIKVIYTNGKVDSQLIWYTPEIKMGPAFSFKSGMMKPGISKALEQLKGFPLKYEMITRRGIIMNVEVVKLDLDKVIDDKEFDIPKDYVIKSIKDMKGPGGPGTVQIRIGN